MKANRAILLVWLTLLTVLLSPSANAHDVANYYPSRWSNGGVGAYTVNWKFAPNFTGSARRARAQSALNRWSNNNPGVFTFNQTADAAQSYNPFQNACNAAVNYNGLYYQSGPMFGETRLCITGTTISRFVLVVQSRSDWDTGSGGTHDFESLVTHEAGHATGFGTKYYITGNGADLHFLPASQPSGICWDDADFHTMCNGLIPVPAKTKTLELHDIHTFTAAY